MDFFTTLLLTFAAILAILSISKIWMTIKTNNAENSATKEAPQPPGCWPIIGHLHLLLGATPPHRVLAALTDRYGPAITFRFGQGRTVVVSSWELARECLIANDRVFATRPLSLASKILGYDGAMFALSPYGLYWRKMRKLATVELLSARRLETFKDMRAREVDLCIKEVFHTWVENGRNPVKIDLKQLLEDLTFNVTMQMVAGKRYFGCNVPEADRKVARQFRVLAKELFELAGSSGFYDFFPFLEWVDVQGNVRAMKRVAKEMDSIMESWIEEHRQKSESEGHRDFIDDLLSTVTEGELTTVHDNATVIKATALTVILGGVDTTTRAMQWAFALLLKDSSNILKKLQDELDMHVGRERMVDESDVLNLKYLQSIVKETLRLYPSAPLLLPHKAMEDCQVGDFKIKRGTGLLVNAWKIHRDPHLWSKPDEFYPERFMTCKEDDPTRLEWYIPFGLGRRSCPGNFFALQVMHLILARLLHSFELRLPPDVGIDFGGGLNCAFLSPLQVLFIPRLSLDLYQ